MVAKGEIDIAKVRQKIKERFKTDKEVDQVAEYYAEAYHMAFSTQEEIDAIWEEIICDSLADMNVFSGSKMWTEAAEHMGMTIPAVQKAVSKGKANQTRGSPEAEGKASREVNYDEETAFDNKKGQNEDERNQYTNILAGKTVSTFDRSEDSDGEYSKNTRKLKGLLGISNEELRTGNFKAGQSEWLENYKGEFGFVDPYEVKRMRRFLQSFCGELSRIKLRSYDTVGRKLPQPIIEQFDKTVFKTQDGTILSLWHWTNKEFVDFKYGDIGFHAGTFDAAHSIMFGKSENGEKGIFKELYVNSQNPLFIERDLGTAWTPHLITNATNVFSNSEEYEINSLDGAMESRYDSEASIRLREILKSKGYDSIIYINAWEGGASVIAFDNEQFYTVAENGIETTGKPSRELDTDYLDAVKSGDMETAQKMVDEAAKKAG